MLKPHELAQFTGTQDYTRWSALFPRMVLTDGAKYVAENGGGQGAYWLMDAIASHQPELRKNPDKRLQEMQFWNLAVSADKTAVLTCVADSGEPPAVEQKIAFTDFDLPEIALWVEPNNFPGDGGSLLVIYLPSEH